METGTINIVIKDIMDEDLNGSLNCPHCHDSWMSIENGVGIENAAHCSHLKFIWYQECSMEEIKFFNGFSLDKLTKAVKKAFVEVYPDEILDEDYEDEELLLDIMFDQDVWKAIKLSDVTAVLTSTLGGVESCGGQSYSVLYGVATE